MYYHNFGYETEFSLDIDDEDVLSQLQGNYDLKDEFEDKLLEELQYTDVSYKVHVDTVNKKIKITLRLEGVDMAVEDAVYDVFRKDGEDEAW